jgi:pyruvate kinase
MDKSKHCGKFVIIATHLLETMIDNQFPTRAETSDVFNSILQQPDCLMLS